MKSTLLKTVLTGAVLLGTMSVANASYLQKTTWTVSNTSTTECGKEHGLWLNDTWHDNPEYCHSDNSGRYYGFDSAQSTFTVFEFEDTADNYAVLSAKANADWGWSAEIDIRFDQWSEDDSKYSDGSARKVKNKEFDDEGKPTVSDPGSFSEDWIFFDDFIGTINFSNDGFTSTNDTYEISYSNLMKKPAMQVGTGANDKDDAFGASVWIDALVGTEYEDWDINMSLSGAIIDIPEVPEVPAPAGLGIFALGLFGLAAARKRKTA